jgi:hypothetical protein
MSNGSTGEVAVLAANATAFTPVAPGNGFLTVGVRGARYFGVAVSVVDGHVEPGTTLVHSSDGTNWTEIPYPAAA